MNAQLATAGGVSLPVPGVYPTDMEHYTDPANLPRNGDGLVDTDKIPDEAIISIASLAAIRGVAVQTVQKDRTISLRRARAADAHAAAVAVYEDKLARFQGGKLRTEPKQPAALPTDDLPRAWDLPAADGMISGSPYWFMKTIRAWLPVRPGRGAGAGRKATGRVKRIRQARLPITIVLTPEMIKAGRVTVTETMVREGLVQTGDHKERKQEPALAV